MAIISEKVTRLKGIGAESAEKLQDLSVDTIEDLLEYYPFRYDDCRLIDVNQAQHDTKITISGFVQTMPVSSFFGKGKSRLSFKMQTGQHLISVNLFNQPYLKNKLQLNQALTVSGKWDRQRLAITASSLKFGHENVTNQFEPVYHLKGDLTTKALRKWIQQALITCSEEIQETLPKQILEKYRLAERRQALQYVHFPQSNEEVKQAKRRFVYEEFLLFQLKMQLLRKRIKESGNGIAQPYEESKVNHFVQTLPFSLTSAQIKVVSEILHDLKSPQSMNRLLQGDVGAGKTVVAAIAVLAAISAGNQAAFMAPTEILAEQHFQSLTKMFSQEGIRIELLTSSVKGKSRTELLSRLAQGDVDLIIGTHALIQKDVIFQKLGLVITDEQHRFGVEQRKVLREKGTNPDVLFMTATPIPRTLAITVFGEMDVSVMNEMPVGRKEIKTSWVKTDQLEQVLRFVKEQIVKGKQAYVICPLIEESEKLDFQNAVDVHGQLVRYFAPTIQVGLMHGRLTSAEKDEIMQKFMKNQIGILVSTTVVEVGVNVPNATCMIIYNAERFGISQLHQLRGRVGRGEEQSYCILIAEPKNEIAVERLTIMTETNDGFYLSERDLQLRGPGDFFGKKQSGVPEFKLADMVNDFHILEIAREDAAKLVNSNAFWQQDDYQGLRKILNKSGIFEGEKLD